MIDLSIVIVNWNSLSTTRECLTSLMTHTQGISYEVFVTDNGTTKDNSVEVLPREFPWVKYIFNDSNMGFTKANNQGIRLAKGRYVLLLNNDTIQIENALAAAVTYMDDRPDIGAMGIKHLNNDSQRSFQISFYDFPSPLFDILGLYGIRRHSSHSIQVVEQDVDWVCGSFLLMRRELIDKVGMLDERYFIYYEDIDWCLQAKLSGTKVRFWPGASMIHLGAASNPLMRDKTLVMFRSHVSYIRKNHGWFAAASYYIAMGIQLSLAFMKQTLRWCLGKASRADIFQRWTRLRSFLTLKPGKVGG
ncbi:MAG: glycosyltransferase family 2 protein [Fimbriiglobus sp.]